MRIRFVAEWMVRDWQEGNGYCFEPEYKSTVHPTEKEAVIAADCGAEIAGLAWREVRRQRYINGRAWVTTAIWRNDGDGWYIPE